MSHATSDYVTVSFLTDSLTALKICRHAWQQMASLGLHAKSFVQDSKWFKDLMVDQSERTQRWEWRLEQVNQWAVTGTQERVDGGELDQMWFGISVKGGWSSSSSSSLPPASAADGTAVPSSVPAAGLVLGQLRLRLPASIASIIAAMVLLVEGYRSRHPAGSSWCELTFFLLCG